MFIVHIPTTLYSLYLTNVLDSLKHKSELSAKIEEKLMNIS